MPTKNLAIMSTDIVGSTPTTAAMDRGEYDRFRARYESVVAPLLVRGGAEIFKSLGDGFLASFESTTDAVLAGMAVQEQLAALRGSLQADERFATRIGISAGDVTLDGTDRFGVPVIMATRVQSIAEPSTTYITESVYFAMNRNEIACDDLGAISLKGLEDRVRIFRARPKEKKSDAQDVAILATDIGSFTRIVDEQSTFDGPAALLADYDAVVFEQALRHHGFIRYNLADAYWISFARAGDALRCAFATWDGLQARDKERRERGGPVTPWMFGIDFGRVATIAGRVYGNALTRGAPALVRIGNGGVHASRALIDAVAREDPAFAAGLVLQANEPMRRKGEAEPLESFQVLSLP